MNKVEEFLLEEAVDDLVLSCDKNGEYVYASDMMQKYADQQCAIQLVSQQRELLSWMKDNHHLGKTEEQINELLLDYNFELAFPYTLVAFSTINKTI